MRLHWFIVVRKLIRQRQETAAIRTAREESFRARLETARAEKTAKESLERKDRRIEELENALASKANDIKSLVELDIPKLKRELEVERHYSDHLAALYEKQLGIVKAEIAVANERIVDATVAEGRMVRGT